MESNEDNLYVDVESNIYNTHGWVIFPKRVHFYIDRYAQEYKVKYKIDAAHFTI